MAQAKGPRRFGAVCVMGIVTLQAAGCGTILYPERKGQTSGRIDPGIAILDGVGILLYVIPGLIAFGVDFTTGAIYLPPDHSGLDNAEGGGTGIVHVNPGDLNHERIEQVIARKTGHTGLLGRKDLAVTRFTDRQRFLTAYGEMQRPAR